MLIRFIAFTALAASAFAQGSPEWTKPFPPFKILGNIYWVGTYDLSTYLITTRGNILINSGLLRRCRSQSRHRIGIQTPTLRSCRYARALDHVAGLAELQKMTGAKVFMSEQDAELLESGGKRISASGEVTVPVYAGRGPGN
jgi:metallo-beta-lactamase class B